MLFGGKHLKQRKAENLGSEYTHMRIGHVPCAYGMITRVLTCT